MDGFVHRVPPTTHWAKALRFATGERPVDAGGKGNRTIYGGDDIRDRNDR